MFVTIILRSFENKSKSNYIFLIFNIIFILAIYCIYYCNFYEYARQGGVVGECEFDKNQKYEAGYYAAYLVEEAYILEGVVDITAPMLGYHADDVQHDPLGDPAYDESHAEYDRGIEKSDDVLIVLKAEDAQNPVYDLHYLLGDGVGSAVVVADEVTYVVDRW